MIVDADCHVSSGPISAVAISADALVTQMAGTSIDKALVWIAPPYERRIEIENRALYEAWQRHPERLLPFGWVNPRLGQASAQATIARCFEEYGFLGIKFNGAQDDYVIDDPVLSLPLIERAAAYGKPIAFHIGADAYENTHPYRLGRIAGLFPKTSLLMVHMGGVGKPSLARAAIETAEAHPNITLIASESASRDILAAIERLGAERICFGSDSPFGFMDVERARFEALLTRIDADAHALIMGQNILRLLGVTA